MNRGSFSTTFGGAPADCPELTLTLELREGRLKGEYVGPAARSFSARSQIDNDGIQAEFQRGRCAYVVTVRRKLAI